ncbi:MAG TPA: hypothetical protein VGV37_07370 [Aliidongia sp.]|uniref:hypothetical protein n=1 Tax=Aliidongia sp. TaxID=1914230 RepID=UPI002DDCAE09|nr:hypothetical protein [Aliidongia sp.]HEV2674346.1 hypothetical protein [Aliidongia sp.]
MADKRHFEDGLYWIQATSVGEAEVALHHHGRWRRFGAEPANTEDLFLIGRRVVVPPDAFLEDPQTLILPVSGSGDIPEAH